MTIKNIIICILIFAYSMIGIENISIIQITLSDSKSGYLQGPYSVKVSMIDWANQTVYWTEQQSIYFNDGFTELKLGPVHNFHDIQYPRVVLEIDNSILDFPIYPALFSVHSKTSEQLADQDAMYVHEGKIGFGTRTPTEKLSVQGHLKFLGANDGIQFQNGTLLSGDVLTGMTTDLTSHSQSISALATQVGTITVNVSAIMSSINILEVSSGANPIQVNSSLNNAILKIDSDGQIAPVNDFYISDANHYLLRTHNQVLHRTKIGNDFIIDDHVLSVGALSSLALKSETLSVPPGGNGHIQYFSGKYYIYQENEWHELIHSDYISPISKMKTVSLDAMSTGSLEGAIAFDGVDYYVWKNAWQKINAVDFSGLSTSDAATQFLLLDSLGQPFKGSLSANKALVFNSSGLQIDDQYLSNHSIPIWDNHKFKSATLGEGLTLSNGQLLLQIGDGLTLSNGQLLLQLGSGLQFSDGHMTLSAPIYVSSNSRVGIGIDPTETLDVNGTLRLRTQTLPTPSNVSAGSIVFDGSDFKGWDGTEWKTFSSSIQVNDNNDVWVYNNHLVANPNGNIGIKLTNPQATLDVSGNLRVRSMPLDQSLTAFMVTNSDGDVFSRIIHAADLLANDAATQIQLDGHTLKISSMNANANEFLSYVDGQWAPKGIVTDDLLAFSNYKLSLSTQNAQNGDVMVFQDQSWQLQPLTDPGAPIIFENNRLKLATQNATVGYQLTWDGSSWVPSMNETVSYLANNGIALNGTSFGLASNLDWSNNTLTIGSTSSAALKVNRLSSTIASPLKVLSASGETLLDVNSSGEISIGFDGAHNGYSIASHGFNLFTHSLSRYQSSVGTTNIGSAEFGPTFLVHSVPYDNPSPTRSILEVLSIDGEPRIEIQEGGNIGISTGHPKATLDINGFAKLKKYTEAPLVCDLDHDGSIALTSQYKLCVCNGSSWVESFDGTSVCEW